MKEKMKNEFIKLFWIFVVVSVIGCAFETVVCIVAEGHFAVRQGVIYGPFIPVYGAGAVLFYLLVPKITGATTKNTNEINSTKIFLYTLILGGVTEYLFSYGQECLFGTVSWEYGDMYFNLNGRTSLFHCICWGLGGILFIKCIYPYTEKWNFEFMGKNMKFVTVMFFIFMVCNMAISMLAGYRQYERTQNIEADTKLEKFLDEKYPDNIMDIIFSNKQYTNQVQRVRKQDSLFKLIQKNLALPEM